MPLLLIGMDQKYIRPTLPVAPQYCHLNLFQGLLTSELTALSS
jgi:hypothetical protein